MRRQIKQVARMHMLKEYTIMFRESTVFGGFLDI